MLQNNQKCVNILMLERSKSLERSRPVERLRSMAYECSSLTINLVFRKHVRFSTAAERFLKNECWTVRGTVSINSAFILFHISFSFIQRVVAVASGHNFEKPGFWGRRGHLGTQCPMGTCVQGGAFGRWGRGCPSLQWNRGWIVNDCNS